MKYRKKPVEVDAVQFTHESTNMLLGWIADEQGMATAHVNAEGRWDAIKVWTLEGEMIAQPGDWIIHGVAGEFYPCKPDIFEATYELVDTDEGSMSNGRD